MKVTIVALATNCRKEFEFDVANQCLNELAAKEFNLPIEAFFLSLDKKSRVQINNIVNGDRLFLMDKSQLIEPDQPEISKPSTSCSNQPSSSAKAVEKATEDQNDLCVASELSKFDPSNNTEAIVAFTHVLFLQKGFAEINSAMNLPANFKLSLSAGRLNLTYVFGGSDKGISVIFVPIETIGADKSRHQISLSIHVVCEVNGIFDCRQIFVLYKELAEFENIESFWKKINSCGLYWKIRSDIIGRAIIAVHDLHIFSAIGNSIPAIMNILQRLTVKDFLAFTSAHQLMYQYAKNEILWKHFLSRDFQDDSLAENYRQRYEQFYRARFFQQGRSTLAPRHPPGQVEPPILPPPLPQPEPPRWPFHPGPLRPPEPRPFFDPFHGNVGGPNDIHPVVNLFPRLPNQGPELHIRPLNPFHGPPTGSNNNMGGGNNYFG